MPADPVGLVRVAAGVVAVAGQRGQVDAADERDLVVDDHELLVVAVHHPPVGVELALDLRALARALALGLHEPAAGLEDRDGRARPDEHPDGDPLGGLGQQLPDRASRRAGRGRSRAPDARSRRGRGAARCGSPRPSRAGRSRRRSAPRARCPRAAGRPSAPTGPRSRARSPRAARGGAAAAGGDGSSRARCRRPRRRRRGLRIGTPMSLAYPLASRSIWPLISPPRSAWPPSVSRCPCSRTIFDPAQMRERLSALEQEMGTSGFWDDPENAAKVSAEHTRTQRRLDTFTKLQSRRRRARRAGRDGRGGPGPRRRTSRTRSSRSRRG